MKCERIFAYRDGSQHVCGRPATHIAHGDTPLCGSCLHDLCEDEPVEYAAQNVVSVCTSENPNINAPIGHVFASGRCIQCGGVPGHKPSVP